MGPGMTTTRIKTTCPRDCYDACGIVVLKKEGRISKVLGDPEHERSRGALCAKCALAYNGVWQDPSVRLLEPLRRSGPKGSGQFVPVSWDEALDDIANHLQSVLGQGSGSSIFHTHYTGTCSLIAGNMPNRFFNRLGATEVDPDTVCNKAGHEALKLMFGNSFGGFDPRTADETQCLLIWGANPSASAPHIHKHWLSGLKKHASLIVVDPIAHDTAQLADIHLQPQPGTDAVLAYGLLHVLKERGMLDEAFIAASVQGWEQIQDEIRRCTPAHVAAITGVDAALLERAAGLYGAGRSLLWMGQGLQRQPQAGNIMRAVALLPTATGNIGKSGSGFFFMNAFPDRGVDMDMLCGTALRSGPINTVSHMDLVEALVEPERCRVLFTWNNNIAASNPRQTDLRQALAREEIFHVALDLFHTDTTRYADYVLPAASFLEFDDLVVSYFDYTVSAQVKAAEPLGQSLPNQEIFRRLALRLGLSDEALYESDAELIASLLVQMGVDESFASLSSKGTIPWRETPVLHFQDGCFPTPSGKVQVAASEWVAAGQPEFPQASSDMPPAPGLYRLLSPADVWLMNSSYGNDERIRTRLGAQKAWIHPDEMLRNGFAEGQRIQLSNASGALVLDIHGSDRVPRQVVLLPKGRWLSHEAANANVNVLNPGEKTDLAESSAVHGVLVRLDALS